jgi:hypothetical protein
VKNAVTGFNKMVRVCRWQLETAMDPAASDSAETGKQQSKTNKRGKTNAALRKR